MTLTFTFPHCNAAVRPSDNVQRNYGTCVALLTDPKIWAGASRWQTARFSSEGSWQGCTKWKDVKLLNNEEAFGLTLQSIEGMLEQNSPSSDFHQDKWCALPSVTLELKELSEGSQSCFSPLLEVGRKPWSALGKILHVEGSPGFVRSDAGACYAGVLPKFL